MPAKPSRTLWPLPGGAGNYMRSLHWILTQVSETTDVRTVVSEMMGKYLLVSSKTAKSYLRVPAALGLIDLVGDSVYITPLGSEYLEGRSQAIIGTALLNNIEGCDEILSHLRARPLRIGILFTKMQSTGHCWATQSQLRYRLRWLEEAGLLERHGKSQPEYRLVG